MIFLTFVWLNICSFNSWMFNYMIYHPDKQCFMHWKLRSVIKYFVYRTMSRILCFKMKIKHVSYFIIKDEISLKWKLIVQSIKVRLLIPVYTQNRIERWFLIYSNISQSWGNERGKYDIVQIRRKFIHIRQ